MRGQPTSDLISSSSEKQLLDLADNRTSSPDLLCQIRRNYYHRGEFKWGSNYLRLYRLLMAASLAVISRLSASTCSDTDDERTISSRNFSSSSRSWSL